MPLLIPLALALPLPLAAFAQSVQTPPPTMVPVPGGGVSPSPFPTVLHTPAPSTQAPRIGAAAAVLADLDTGQVLFAQNADQRRPVASLTKIMTALLVLQRAKPSDVVVVSAQAADPAPVPGVSNLGLRTGERISIEQLLYALILQSANDAAVALAEYTSGSVPGFVDAMNAEARALGARDTRFASPNGLDDDGFSTAADILTMTRAGYEEPLFAKVAATKVHEVPPPQPGGTPRVVQNRNVLLWLYPGAIGAKTGFTSAAGYCVVGVAERDGLRLVTVVLGDPGEPFSDAAALLNYGFEGFERRLLIEEGEPFGTVSIQGREVAVATGGRIERLVPVEADILRQVRINPGLAFPPTAGQQVAHVTVSASGQQLGRVPLVVSSVPPPPPPRPGTWWGRVVTSAASAVSSLVHALFG